MVVTVVVVLVVTRLLVAPLPSDGSLGWRSAFGVPGAGLEAGNVVSIEVERPACARTARPGWRRTIVTYTPLAVFITIRMADTFDASGCSVAKDGRLPTVGSYLTGTYVPVHLSQPLGGRVLFDGGGLLPEPRF